VTSATQEALTLNRLSQRAYSASMLQRFATCPYQFLLAAVFRLQPLEAPAPLERIDPMTRGSLTHEVQARLMRRLKRAGSLPLSHSGLAGASEALDEIVDDVMEQAREELAPAVDRVWLDDVASMRRDLHGWLERTVEEAEWVPEYFEFAFGRIPGTRDPASRADPVLIDDKYPLRGAIDLVERHRATGELRVTDYKTGRAPDSLDTLVVGGGSVLQPVLYGLAAERALGAAVRESRLYFCTATAGFRSSRLQLDPGARRAGVEVLEIIDRAIELGTLMAAPTAKACERCDFRPVCGPGVPRRVAHKRPGMLRDLSTLRGLK